VFYIATPEQIKNGIITPPHLCKVRVMPWDIDYNLHLNNASYLTMLEYARINWAVDSGCMAAAMKRGYTLGIAGLAIQYRREVRLFERVCIETRYMCNDDKFFYVEQVMYKDNKKRDFVSRAIIRIYMISARKRTGILHPKVFLDEVCGYGDKAQFVFDFCKEILNRHPRTKLMAQLQDNLGENAALVPSESEIMDAVSAVSSHTSLSAEKKEDQV
jgi:acyl-CoA thioesterase FadM